MANAAYDSLLYSNDDHQTGADGVMTAVGAVSFPAERNRLAVAFNLTPSSGADIEGVSIGGQAMALTTAFGSVAKVTIHTMTEAEIAALGAGPHTYAVDWDYDLNSSTYIGYGCLLLIERAKQSGFSATVTGGNASGTGVSLAFTNVPEGALILAGAAGNGDATWTTGIATEVYERPTAAAGTGGGVVGYYENPSLDNRTVTLTPSASQNRRSAAGFYVEREDNVVDLKVRVLGAWQTAVGCKRREGGVWVDRALRVRVGGVWKEAF